MKKIRIVEGSTSELLEAKANLVLQEIKTDDVDIKYMLPENMIVIEYCEHERSIKCMDCQYYDKDGDIRGAWALCQKKGVRVRFSQNRCECFEDVRG